MWGSGYGYRFYLGLGIFCTALALENGSVIRIVMNALYRAVREQGVGFQYSPTAAASVLLLGSIGLKILWR